MSLTLIFFSWYSAVDTLAKLHSVDYKAIGLANYGKSSGFYSRQIRSLVKVSTSQAAVKDENGIEVGPIPRLDDLIKWFNNFWNNNILIPAEIIVHSGLRFIRFFSVIISCEIF